MKIDNCFSMFGAKRLIQQTRLYSRPFEELAAQWPHYVIPPSNPFAVIDPSCPCSFFEA